MNIFFGSLLIASRLGFYRYTAGFLISIIFIVSSYCIYNWGILLPQAILTFGLTIIISGALLGSQASFYITAAVIIALVTVKTYEIHGIISTDRSWALTAGGYNDIVVFGGTFMAIAIVTWLSNREIERSLHRALKSESDLLKERKLLEIKVQERTAELEKTQVEKMLELHRFAEFGRLSSTLLHDLANPLTSVSLELEQMHGKNGSATVQRARQGLAYMEQYVTAARRQLRNQSELRDFNPATEIKLVVGFLKSKALRCRVKIILSLDHDINLHGDPIRFNQVTANLIANAIDAYESSKPSRKNNVYVQLQQIGTYLSLTVSDHGAGIDRESLKRVFEPFYTTKASLRGTGIGLSITRQAVEQDFEGTISVVSQVGKGTTFTVCIPLI